MHDTKNSLKTCAHEVASERYQKSQNQSDINLSRHVAILLTWLHQPGRIESHI